MTIQALQELVQRYSAGASALCSLAALIDSRITGTPLDPAVESACKRVADALGAEGALDGLSAAELAPVLARIRHDLVIDTKLLYEQTRARGWMHADPDTLQAAGTFSAGFVQPLSRAIVPSLPGLADRLASPGAAFLDIGVGVAGLSIAVARNWPQVRVVGVDPWAPSIALARQNVAAAGLADRIELREQGAETLRDEAVFDLAWVPLAFIPQQVTRGDGALRSGGWVLLAGVNTDLPPVPSALMQLRMTMFGNNDLTPSALESVARELGLADVRATTIPGPPVALVTGRKP
jgi:hypothetical protein